MQQGVTVAVSGRQTSTELERQLELWQRILRLQDWDVTVWVVRAPEMKRLSSLGECEFNLARKTAAIRILGDDDIVATGEGVDQEVVLVHELLHLHFAPLNIEVGTPEDLVEEQAVNALALALVALARQEIAK